MDWLVYDSHTIQFQVLIHSAELTAISFLTDCTISVELANLIQLLTQLTYNNCAKYAPMVDLTTLSILTLSLLIKLTGSTSPIFRLRRACFRVIKSCSRHLVPIPSPLSTGSAVTRKFSLTPLRLQWLRWVTLVCSLGRKEKSENIVTLLTRNLLKLILLVWPQKNHQQRVWLPQSKWIRMNSFHLKWCD